MTRHILFAIDVLLGLAISCVQQPIAKPAATEPCRAICTDVMFVPSASRPIVTEVPLNPLWSPAADG